jgi:hypothetical protein
MEPARSRRTGILQVKEFSTGKGIKPPIEARFLQVKEKRQTVNRRPATSGWPTISQNPAFAFTSHFGPVLAIKAERSLGGIRSAVNDCVEPRF